MKNTDVVVVTVNQDELAERVKKTLNQRIKESAKSNIVGNEIALSKDEIVPSIFDGLTVSSGISDKLGFVEKCQRASNITVNDIYKLYKLKKLVLPSWQRGAGHYDESGRSNIFAQAIISGYVEGTIIIAYCEEDDLYYVIDGQQRLFAIFSYIEGKYPLKDMDLKVTVNNANVKKAVMSLNGRYYTGKNFPKEYKSAIKKIQLNVECHEYHTYEELDEVEKNRFWSINSESDGLKEGERLNMMYCDNAFFKGILKGARKRSRINSIINECGITENRMQHIYQIMSLMVSCTDYKGKKLFDCIVEMIENNNTKEQADAILDKFEESIDIIENADIDFLAHKGSTYGRSKLCLLIRFVRNMEIVSNGKKKTFKYADEFSAEAQLLCKKFENGGYEAARKLLHDRFNAELFIANDDTCMKKVSAKKDKAQVIDEHLNKLCDIGKGNQDGSATLTNIMAKVFYYDLFYRMVVYKTEKHAELQDDAADIYEKIKNTDESVRNTSEEVECEVSL